MNDKTSGGWGEGVLSTFGRFNERGCRGGAVRFRPIQRAGGGGGCCPPSADSTSGGAVRFRPIQRAGGGGGGGGGVDRVVHVHVDSRSIRRRAQSFSHLANKLINNVNYKNVIHIKMDGNHSLKFG